MEQKEFNEWLALRKELIVVRKREAELRKIVGALVMGTDKTGTNHAELFSHELKATIPVQYTVNADVRLAKLTDRQKACITWKPSLVVEEYKKLMDDEKEALSAYITTKPGSLSIEVGEVQL